MPRPHVVYGCSECGYESPAWLGRCPGCGSWNGLAERSHDAPGAGARPSTASRRDAGSRGDAVSRGDAGLKAFVGRYVPLSEIDPDRSPRHRTGLGEFDRVLGGGIVPGSIVLVGGEPGIGKSTLLLQIGCNVAGTDVAEADAAGSDVAGSGGAGAAAGDGNATRPVLYVSGEESPHQIAGRAARLGIAARTLERVAVASESDVEQVEALARMLQPRLVIIDSIQTMTDPSVSAPAGTVVQVKQCAERLMRFAKETDVPVFLVGHLTKSGELAGPRVLEHMVDAVLYFEMLKAQGHRALRATKNRFGSTNEVAVFSMGRNGLSEVADPSWLFLAGRLAAPRGSGAQAEAQGDRVGNEPQVNSGSVVVPCLEGTRPILVEVQALVAAPAGPVPRRVVTGVDYNRACIVLAVLEKRVGLQLSSRDVYISVAGGLVVEEPASDLGVAVAVASSLKDVAVAAEVAVAGEIGLSGEIRAVDRAAARVAEARKLGFATVLVPAANLGDLEEPSGVLGVSGVRQALYAALPGAFGSAAPTRRVGGGQDQGQGRGQGQGQGRAQGQERGRGQGQGRGEAE